MTTYNVSVTLPPAYQVDQQQTITSYDISATFGEGPRGRSVLTGYGVPDVSTGQEGDLYLDLNLSMLYGPKTSGSWGTGDALTPAVKVGTVTTLTPGEQATVTVESSNDTATLSFGIPAGAPGDTVGPSSAVDGHLVVFNGTTGKLFKDGGAIPQPTPLPADMVTGPASAVAGHMVTFADATGKVLADGGAVPDPIPAAVAVASSPDPIAVADVNGVTGKSFGVLIGPGYPAVLDTLATAADVAASSTAMAAVAASSTAVAAAAASPTAMGAMAASSTAMAALSASATARGILTTSATAQSAMLASPLTTKYTPVNTDAWRTDTLNFTGVFLYLSTAQTQAASKYTIDGGTATVFTALQTWYVLPVHSSLQVANWNCVVKTGSPTDPGIYYMHW